MLWEIIGKTISCGVTNVKYAAIGHPGLEIESVKKNGRRRYLFNGGEFKTLTAAQEAAEVFKDSVREEDEHDFRGEAQNDA